MADIVIFGCGPAGLIAAQAASDAGVEDILIISRKQKSRMPGAQYLHEPIPGVSPDLHDAAVRYWKVGTKEGYASKVYGDPSHPVSWDKFSEGRHPAWRLADAYDILWERWKHSIKDESVDWFKTDYWRKKSSLVISTIPLRTICAFPDRHDFQSARVWFKGGLAEPMDINTILYSGRPEDKWYRQSSIFGVEWTEYAGLPFVRGYVTLGHKPTTTTCECWDGKILTVGRFGNWDKNALLHHVYPEVQNAVQQL
jgi:hypothetical protein